MRRQRKLPESLNQMDLSPEQVGAVTEWRKKSSGRKTASLGEIQGILGLEKGCIARDDYELDGHFAFPVDEPDFDPDYIQDDLTPNRYDALIGGAKPTSKELKRWSDEKESLVFEEDGWWFHFYLWRVDLPEETLYFRSLHGDGGVLDYFDGPYRTEKQALDDASNLELNPR